MDFLDPGAPALLHPEGIVAPQTTGPSGPVTPPS